MTLCCDDVNPRCTCVILHSSSPAQGEAQDDRSIEMDVIDVEYKFGKFPNDLADSSFSIVIFAIDDAVGRGYLTNDVTSLSLFSLKMKISKWLPTSSVLVFHFLQW